MAQVIDDKARRTAYANLCALLEKRAAEFRSVIPKGSITVDRFVQTCKVQVWRQPDLLGCEPTSFFVAALTAAKLGLLPDPLLQHAWILPYEDRRRGTVIAVLRIGYRGYADIAWRENSVLISANVVKKGDRFTFVDGDEPKIEHEPDLESDDPGRTIAAYAIATFPDGRRKRCVVPARDLAKIRATTSSRDRQGNIVGPQAEWEEEMDKKAAVRRLWKLLPSSSEATRTIAEAEDELQGADAGVVQEAGKPRALEPASAPTGDIVAQAEDELGRSAATVAETVRTEQAARQPEPVRVGNQGEGGAAPAPRVAAAEAAEPAAGPGRRRQQPITATPAAKVGASRSQLVSEIMAFESRLNPDQIEAAYDYVGLSSSAELDSVSDAKLAELAERLARPS